MHYHSSEKQYCRAQALQPRVAQKNSAIRQTDAERRFKQKPYLSCNLRFSTRTIIASF